MIQGLMALVGSWLLAGISRQGLLVWGLLHDRRVPLRLRALPLLAVLYVLSPIDLIPDAWLGLGELDDLIVLFLALRALVGLAPQYLVQEHLARLAGGQAPARHRRPASVVDSTGRVVDDLPGRSRSSRSDSGER